MNTIRTDFYVCFFTERIDLPHKFFYLKLGNKCYSKLNI